MGRSEYLIVIVLVVISALAAPAFRDVQAVQSFVISLCATVGLN